MVVVYLTALLIGFQVGERLRFSVKYGPIPAGEMILQILESDTIKNKPVIHLQMLARTRGPFNFFFSVADSINSWVQQNPFATHRYEKVLKEGRYRNRLTIVYDPEKRIAIYPDDTIRGIPENALDPLSLYYYVRTIDLRVGDTILVPFHVDKRSRNLKIFVKKKEPVKTRAGAFRCFVLEPEMGEASLMKSDGKITIWISDDANRYPVKIKTNLSFGSLTAYLVEVGNTNER